MQLVGRPRTAAALLRAMVSGRGQFPTFAAKYAKGSAILRTGDAEHKLGHTVASDAANYVRSKLGTLDGHGERQLPDAQVLCRDLTGSPGHWFITDLGALSEAGISGLFRNLSKAKDD